MSRSEGSGPWSLAPAAETILQKKTPCLTQGMGFHNPNNEILVVSSGEADSWNNQ
jgi:hypothetical protein